MVYFISSATLSTVLIDAPELVMTLGILGGRSILIKES